MDPVIVILFPTSRRWKLAVALVNRRLALIAPSRPSRSVWSFRSSEMVKNCLRLVTSNSVNPSVRIHPGPIGSTSPATTSTMVSFGSAALTGRSSHRSGPASVNSGGWVSTEVELTTEVITTVVLLSAIEELVTVSSLPTSSKVNRPLSVWKTPTPATEPRMPVCSTGPSTLLIAPSRRSLVSSNCVRAARGSRSSKKSRIFLRRSVNTSPCGSAYFKKRSSTSFCR